MLKDQPLTPNRATPAGVIGFRAVEGDDSASKALKATTVPLGGPGDVAPRPTLIPDRPDALTNDAFDHASYARTLASVIRATEHSCTIGLYGSWGLGKSSILQRLKTE